MAKKLLIAGETQTKTYATCSPALKGSIFLLSITKMLLTIPQKITTVAAGTMTICIKVTKIAALLDKGAVACKGTNCLEKAAEEKANTGQGAMQTKAQFA